MRLIEQITQAFADVEYPGDIELTRSHETKDFIGKHWKDLSLDTLSSQSHINYLSPKALRFFLPAYLIAILSSPEKMNTLVDDIVFFLSPSPSIAEQGKTIPYLVRLEAKERNAVREFIESYEELFPEGSWKYYEPSAKALKRAITYWQQHG